MAVDLSEHTAVQPWYGCVYTCDREVVVVVWNTQRFISWVAAERSMRVSMRPAWRTTPVLRHPRVLRPRRHRQLSASIICRRHLPADCSTQHAVPTTPHTRRPSSSQVCVCSVSKIQHWCVTLYLQPVFNLGDFWQKWCWKSMLHTHTV